MVKKIKKVLKRVKREPKMKYGDDSDYQRRVREGTTSKIKVKKQKEIKIMRKKNKDDPRKCPKCKKIGELIKRTPIGKNVHYTYKCSKHGYYSFTEKGRGSEELIE